MDSLQYQIDVDDTPAQAGTARVNRAFDSVSEHARLAAAGATGAFATASAAIVAASGHTERAFTAMGSAAAGFTHFVVKGTEAALTAASSFAILAGAVTHFGAAATASSGGIASMLNGLRALRIAASATLPEVFGSLALSGTTVGAGILAEAALQAASSRAKQIEQQSQLAVLSSLKFQGSTLPVDLRLREVSAAYSATSLSGGDFAKVRSLQEALGSQFETNVRGTKDALQTLGVSSSFQDLPSADALQAIAAGLSNLTDETKKYKAAAALFGADKAGEAVEQLNARFAEGSRYVKDFGLVLDQTTTNQLSRFRKDMADLKSFFTDFSWMDAWGMKIAQVLAVGVGKADDLVHKFEESNFNAAYVGQRLGQGLSEKYIPGAREYHAMMRGEYNYENTRAEAARTLGKGVVTIRDSGIEYSTSAANKAVLDEAQADLKKAQEDLDARKAAATQTRDKYRNLLKEDQHWRNLHPNAPGLLSAADLVAASGMETSASRLVATLDEQKKAKDEAEGLSKEVRKHQIESLRTSQETAFRSSFEPGAGKDIRSEILKATTLVDKDGELHTFKLLDETRRNLETAFHRYVLDLGEKAARQRLKYEEEIHNQIIAYADKERAKRAEFAESTRQVNLATNSQEFSRLTTVAGYAKDERLADLAGLNSPQTVAGKLALEQRKLGIEKDFLLESATYESEKIVMLRDRKLDDLQLEKERVDRQFNRDRDLGLTAAGQQAPSELRAQAINRSAAAEGTALNDKFAHDNITAQQAAANASVQIVRDAQTKEFDSLKNSAEGVLNSMETRGVGVFQAIANSAKVSFLAAFNQIISSQIAASLFRILNPGQTVEFDHSGQGKGKFAGILGGLGLGTQPVFGGDVPGVTMPLKSNTDATDRNTAAIQDLTNAIASGGSQASQGQRRLIPRFGAGGSFPMAGAAMAGFGAFMQLVPGLGFAGGASGGSQGTAIDTTINYATGGSESFGSTSLAAAGMDGGSYASGGESMGVPTGYDLPSAAGLSIPGVGGAGGLIGGGASGGAAGGKGGFGGGFNLTALKGSFFNSGSISLGNGSATTAAGISQSLGGGALGKLSGGVAGFASSDAGFAVGSGLLLSGLQGKTSVASGAKTTLGGALVGANIGSKVGSLGIAGGALVGAGAGLFADGMRRGGFTGLGEDIAGGAAIGLQFGGPIGALVGAAVGAVAGTIRMFFKGDRQHTKDLVQQIYGIKINDAMADQIMELAKQKYGGQISVAVRSQEVRDLLKLYAESIGSPSAKQFVGDRVHSASLAEFGGKLQQGAVYDNGRAYAYASSLPTVNGIPTDSLPTISRYAGGQAYGTAVFQIDSGATRDLWRDGTTQAIQGNPRLVASAAVNGYSQSAGSSGNRAAVLSPSAIDR